MRAFNIVMFLLFIAAVGVFCVQNQETIAVKFITTTFELPFWLLALIFYILGMLSGWAMLSYISRSARRLTNEL